MNVVTRFAPSPTGYLHIGGARTAIFNYLFAKKHSGKYLVRIEDTDKKRSSEKAIKAIHEGLNWLNVNSEYEIVYQSQNFNSHIKVAYELLKKGFAYKCFLNSEEFEKLRIKSRENGIPIKSPWRNKKESYDTKNKEFVIRLKMPIDGSTTIDDIVQGKVTVKNEILDDMIILRSDNTPTYMLSSVVDDHNMGITHIIRGDDHFNNAFRQIQIIKYLNWNVPFYAHIPLIHGADGAKLSKRHGATSLFDYHDLGYTSEAMFSYLLQLGWSAKNDEDYFIDRATKLFTLEKINKSPAKFDLKKLNYINAKKLNSMKLSAVYKLVIDKFNLSLNDDEQKRFKSLLPELLKRVQVYTDLKDEFDWLFQQNFFCKDKNYQLKLQKNNLMLKDIGSLLKECEWNLENIKSCLNQFILENSLTFKEIGPMLRMALTGKTNSPDLILIIYELGCTITVNRLNYKY